MRYLKGLCAALCLACAMFVATPASADPVQGCHDYYMIYLYETAIELGEEASFNEFPGLCPNEYGLFMQLYYQHLMANGGQLPLGYDILDYYRQWITSYVQNIILGGN